MTDDATAATLAGRFEDLFGMHPDGVWSAPGRVNVIGEHTDYNAGLSLPMAIGRRCHVAARGRADGTIRVRSAQSDVGWAGTLDDVGPGRPAGWVAYPLGVLWALRERGVTVPGVDLLVDSQVPAGAGLSSSAALTCSVARAVADLTTEPLSTSDLLRATMTAENVVAGTPTGGLDQTAALRARVGHVLLIDFRDGSTEPIPWHLPALGWTLLVTDTRTRHALTDGAYAERRAQCDAAARTLGLSSLRDVDPDRLDEALARLTDPVLRRRVRHVVTETQRVRTASAALRADDVAGLGAAMSASHRSLRDDFEVSCPELDVAVVAAGEAGAVGARMTGGGFGGSAVALVRHDEVGAVESAVRAASSGRGHAEPAFLVVEPGGPARRDA